MYASTPPATGARGLSGLSGRAHLAVWAGLYICLMIEIGLLTPPFGVNLFVMVGATGVDFMKVVRGSYPYVLMLLFMTALICLLPIIVDFIPGTMP